MNPLIRCSLIITIISFIQVSYAADSTQIHPVTPNPIHPDYIIHSDKAHVAADVDTIAYTSSSLCIGNTTPVLTHSIIGTDFAGAGSQMTDVSDESYLRQTPNGYEVHILGFSRNSQGQEVGVTIEYTLSCTESGL